MKKPIYLLLALAMCASLSACGGGESGSSDVSSESTVSDTVDEPDVSSEDSDSDTADGPTEEQLNALTEAYNEVAILYNDVTIMALDNGWEDDQETSAAIDFIANILEPVGLALTGDMSALDGADFDALPGVLLELVPDLEALSEKVSVPYEGGEAGGEDVAADEEIAALIEAYNVAVPLFNDLYETAAANGWLDDEETAAGLQELSDSFNYVASGLTEDPSMLEDVDINGLIDLINQFIAEYENMAELVSVPYGDVG